MIGTFKRYDMSRRPKRPKPFLLPAAWVLSFPSVWSHRLKLDKSMLPTGLKPPYFLLCNHNAFMDFKVMTRATFPHRSNYVVAIDGFIGRERLLRAVGGICTRKLAGGTALIRNMLRARDNGDIVVMYPEAHYSLCGTGGSLPDSLGKAVRIMNIPVVTLIAHGHHVNSPFWHTGNRGAKPIEAKMELLLSQEETQVLPTEAINARLSRAFAYDDFAWQKEKRIYIESKTRAEGLHKVLYQCPSCKTEGLMESLGTRLRCTHCGKMWEMSKLGELRAQEGKTEFSHIPDWYEWQRANVRREIEAGEYTVRTRVRIESLPNSKGFVTLDEPGQLTHSEEGFSLSGSQAGVSFTLSWPAYRHHFCHIEYDYQGRGDCIDLNTNYDTFYLFPEDSRVSVTKVALAAEVLYERAQTNSKM